MRYPSGTGEGRELAGAGGFGDLDQDPKPRRLHNVDFAKRLIGIRAAEVRRGVAESVNRDCAVSRDRCEEEISKPVR